MGDYFTPPPPIVVAPTVPTLKMAARKRIEEALWHRVARGEAGLEWKLEDHQKKVYSSIKAAGKIKNSRFVLNASRRWGKTFMLCCLVIEYALANPGVMIMYCGSSQKAVKEFIIPTFSLIFNNCPAELQGSIKTQTGNVYFKNGSWIKITGLDGGRLQKLRGLTAHMVVVDEAGFIDNLGGAVHGVLFPMTSSTGGQMILSSNSPMTPGHDFVEIFVREAEEANLYCVQTIYDVPKYTNEDIERFAASVGGKDNSTFKREYLCKIVTDEHNAVIPEWNKYQDKVVKDPGARPEFFYAMVSGDIGLVDFTGVLFGYYDFVKGAAVVEDEILMRGTDSEKLVKACKAKELELWGPDILKRPTRVFDGQAFTINDLAAVHKYPVGSMNDRGSLESQVNAIRLDVQNGKLIIHPRCKLLIGQIQDATWTISRNEFKRNKKNGHFDLLASLQGFVKYINRTSNPFPNEWDWRTSVIHDSKQTSNAGYQKLKKIWGHRG